MPQSWPVNPDDPFMQLKENDIDDVQSNNLRGNLEWAPPRPQIVFAVYSSPKYIALFIKSILISLYLTNECIFKHESCYG